MIFRENKSWYLYIYIYINDNNEEYRGVRSSMWPHMFLALLHHIVKAERAFTEAENMWRWGRGWNGELLDYANSYRQWNPRQLLPRALDTLNRGVHPLGKREISNKLRCMGLATPNRCATRIYHGVREWDQYRDASEQAWCSVFIVRCIISFLIVHCTSFSAFIPKLFYFIFSSFSKKKNSLSNSLCFFSTVFIVPLKKTEIENKIKVMGKIKKCRV